MSHDFFFPLLRKRKIATHTYEFVFLANSEYTYQPGQYAYVSLRLPNGRVESRIFSFVHTKNSEQTLTIAARIRPESAYKQKLVNLKKGERVQFSPALGFFQLANPPITHHVFIAGGIGIIPFISLLEDLCERSQRQHALSFYISNQTSATATYLDELTQLSSSFPKLRVYTRFTRQGDKRYTVSDFLDSDSQQTTHFYLAGTPDMVSQYEQGLRQQGISLNNISLEAFTGYEV